MNKKKQKTETVLSDQRDHGKYAVCNMKSRKEFRIQGGGQGCRDVEVTEDWCRYA